MCSRDSARYIVSRRGRAISRDDDSGCFIIERKTSGRSVSRCETLRRMKRAETGKQASGLPL